MKYGFGLSGGRRCFCDKFDSIEELIAFAKEQWQTKNGDYFDEDDGCCICIGTIKSYVPSDFASSLDWVADEMTDRFYAEHNIDDDADVQINNRKEAEKAWKEFIDKYFELPCTFICDFFDGVYDLDEDKWVNKEKKK